MKAKSDLLATHRRGGSAPVAAPHPGPHTAPAKPRKRGPLRLPREARRAQILAQAYEFFSEYGLTAQTRALAASCGVSQRLLYSFFPSKAALLEEVYRSEIAGSFKAIWFAELKDRSLPMEQRLLRLYREYYDSVTTRRWLRLFLYASLAEVAMAPAYITGILTHMLEIIVAEAAAEQGLQVPADPATVQEVGWILHGAISHLAIRRHVYCNTNPVPAHEVIALQVRAFLGGLPAVLPKPQ
ncbi:MAG: TetR/AcrR family transcriptional regulator [Rubrivivax sp.]|nr:TetR/AcrR family transcriptional regulator [Rubrivivax sp.]